MNAQTPHIALQQCHLSNAPSQCWSMRRGFHLMGLNKDFVERAINRSQGTEV
jgi:hypothetical protein